MFSRGPNLHISVVVKLICGLIIFNQSIGSFISASSVFKSSSSSSWRSNSTPLLSRSAQQDRLGLSQPEIATKRSDAPGRQEEKILSIEVQREPITLIERLSRARVVRSEKFKDFQESLMERLENVRNRRQQPDQKDVYKLDINLPILSTTPEASNDNAQLDYNNGESVKFESLDENNEGQQEDDALESRKLKTIGAFYPSEPATSYLSPQIKSKLRRALRDVTTGGQSSGGSTSSEPLDFSGPITGGGGLPNHVAPTDVLAMGQPVNNNNENLSGPQQQQASRYMEAAKVALNQPPSGQTDLTDGGGQQTSRLNSGSNSDSVTADTMWPPEKNMNMNHKSAHHRPRTPFDEFGRRNVKPGKVSQQAEENGLQKDGQNENFPDIPVAELMNENPFPVAANKFEEYNDNMNGNTNLAAASGFNDGVGSDRKQALNAAESYDHTIKCAEKNVESQGEVQEESPKRIEAYEEEEYHAIPVKKIIENHHHHHHHHHHEQKKIIQKEVKKVQQQVQPVHLEIHIKGKTKGKEKRKEKSKGKGGKGKAKAKGKSKGGEEVYVKFQNGEQSQGSQEEYKKADEGGSVEDNKSLIGDGESDGGGGQADEGKRSALADAAPIKSAPESGDDSGAGGGDEEKTTGAKGETETGAAGEGESSQNGAAADGGDGGGKGQQQGQVDGENSGASSDDLMGHVINTSQVPNHYFDIHDHSQEGGQQSSGHEQGHQKQEEQHQEGQKQQDKENHQEQQHQQVEEEKKAEAQVENGGDSAKQDSGQQHEHGHHHHHEKKHSKKAEKVQQVKQEAKKEKQEVKKEKHHQHQEPKKHKEVVEEKKKVEQPVVHKQVEKHVEPVKEEPKKVVEQHKQPHKQEEQHKHKQKSKHQHIEVHQHKHFELHKHINLHQPEAEHEIQPHGGHMVEGEGHQDEHGGFEGGPVQHEHPQHLNDGYLHQNQHQMVGHGMHEHHEHQHQPMHGEHHEEQGHHHAMPIKHEEWIAPELHHEKPGAIVIEDHSELERHHHQHPMEVGYNEEIIHHPHGLGLTPVAAYKLMGAYSAPTVSHSTRNSTTNKSPTRDEKEKRTGNGSAGEARGGKATLF